MRTIALGTSGLRSSVLGFGCGSLMGSTGRRTSLRALHSAYDAGITFFDTARSYGQGESETVLGEFLAGRRDKVVIATKFGTVQAPQMPWLQLVKPLARAVLPRSNAARAIARRSAAAQLSKQFTVAVLQRSVEESLRQLRTDYVDMLLMHGPPREALGDDDLLRAMEQLVASGKVRIAGISTDPPVLQSVLERAQPLLRSIQFPCNLLDCAAVEAVSAYRDSGLIFVANNPFGGAGRVHQIRDWLAHLAHAETTPPAVREKLLDPSPGVFSDAVLNSVLVGTGIHVVLSAMTRPEHIQENVQSIEHSRFQEDELEWLRGVTGRGFEEKRILA